MVWDLSQTEYYAMNEVKNYFCQVTINATNLKRTLQLPERYTMQRIRRIS
jgi:hypothetical protein